MLASSHPILSCEQAKQLEDERFGSDEERAWNAMRQAGRAIGRAVMADSREMGGLPFRSHILALIGKGHNGGDALIAVETLLEAMPGCRAGVLFAFGERALRPLASRAWKSLSQRFRERVTRVAHDGLEPAYALVLDGVFGFQYRPPIDDRIRGLIDRVNGLSIPLRIAVDLPSAGLFRADFTYATGSVKEPGLTSSTTGRLRYLDLGFFPEYVPAAHRVLTSALLEPLRQLRAPTSDKRSYGHVFIMGGSRSFPGAVMMTVMAALRSGVGLLTAFVPESLVPAFSAHVPEAMWVGCPEEPGGGLALEGLHLIRERMERATAWVIGPGLAREPESLALAREVVELITTPVVLDADALRTEVIQAVRSRLILTPHEGEFQRIAESVTLRRYAEATRATVVLKGPITRICGRSSAGKGGAGAGAEPPVYYSLFGGPVLARGGSGDLLAGLIGGLVAQRPDDLLLAAAQGTVWHGMAADRLARSRGQIAVTTTQLLGFLSDALLGTSNEPDNE